ncbi:hypothetical protein, partial [Burkholderia stagnalis]|uniref:hypothetical protein n=1 Tax=Burkholderia stagnalis TaxID=1503054 RepID=UPI001E3A2570
VVPMPEVNSSLRKLTAPRGLFETVSKVDSERQKKLSIFVHISELDVFRSCIVDELAAEVERPLLAECRRHLPHSASPLRKQKKARHSRANQ